MAEEEKNETLSWRAAEYHFAEKSVFWFGSISGVTIVLMLIALWQKNFFFAVFITVAGVMLMFFGRNRPAIHDFRIDDEGVGVGERDFYEYDKLQGFSMLQRSGRLDEIILLRDAAISPHLRIPIDSKSAVKAREILEKRIPELEHEESLIDILSDWLGF